MIYLWLYTLFTSLPNSSTHYAFRQHDNVLKMAESGDAEAVWRNGPVANVSLDKVNAVIFSEPPSGNISNRG